MELLLAICAVLAALLCRPAAFADGGGTDGSAAADAGGQHTGAHGESAGAAGDVGASSAADARPSDSDPVGLVDRFLEATGLDEDEGEQSSQPPRTPPAAPGVPPAPQTPGQLSPQEIFARLGVDPQLLEGVPAEAHGPAAELMRRLYSEHYEPVAREVALQHEQVRQWYGQLQEYHAHLEQMEAAPEFALARQLASDPGLLQRVNAILSGQQPAGELTREQLEALDPEQRALYERTNQVQLENQALHQHVSGLHQQLESLTADLQQMQQEAQRERHVTNRAVASTLLSHAVEAARQELGFDPTQYGPQFQRAIAYARDALAAEVQQWQQAQAAGRSPGPPPSFSYARHLRAGLAQAGFGDIWQRLQAQARGAAPPAGRRAAAAPANSAEALVEQFEAESGVDLSAV